MTTFSDRLRAVIGSRVPHEWAKSHGFRPQKVWDWLKHKRDPQNAQIIELAKVTGIPEAWWLDGDLPPPAPVKPAPVQAQPGPQRAAAVSYHLHASEPAPDGDFGEINTALLDASLRACQAVHGEPFAAATAPLQLRHAVELYNLLVRMASQAGKSPKDAMRLEIDGLADQLRLFLKMGWASPFPPPESAWL